MLLYWLWYAQRKIPDWVKCRILQHFSDPEEIYLGGKEAFSRIEAVEEKYIKELENKDLSSARKILENCQKQEIGILPFSDPGYPPKLRHISDPPMVLYYKGVLPKWESLPVIGIVGTRKATSYGLQMALTFGRQIARGGGLIVSGCASGIDAMAMQGAIAEEKPTVGVLGSGVDIIYPKSNTPLFKKVPESGCLLSEQPPKTPPYKWNFPRRNRIISGISNGVLVVEAPDESGALITAGVAKEQGRDVFVIPGNVGNPICNGSNALLQKGAIAALSGWDVLQEYETLYPQAVRKPEIREFYQENTPLLVAQTPIRPKKEEKKIPAADKKSIDKEEKSPYSVSGSVPILSPEEKAILAVLSKEPQPMDEILSRLDMPAGQALSLITKLTLKGAAVQHPGKRVSL